MHDDLIHSKDAPHKTLSIKRTLFFEVILAALIEVKMELI